APGERWYLRIAQEPLRYVLVHRDARAERPGAGVADAVQLQEGLEAPVLSDPAMKGKEGDVGIPQLRYGRDVRGAQRGREVFGRGCLYAAGKQMRFLLSGDVPSGEIDGVYCVSLLAQRGDHGEATRQ